MTQVSPSRRPGRPPGGKREPVGIQSVEIACRLLEIIRRAHTSLSLTELSVASGLQPSKLHRYLVSLSREGMIARTANGTHALGPAARALGAAALTRFDEFEVVNSALNELGERSGMTLFLYIWIESGPVLIRTLTTWQTGAITLRIGSSLPLLDSGCGPVFLAYLPSELTDPLLRLDGQSISHHTRPGDDPAAIERMCRKIRAEGVHCSENGVIRGRVCAAPIFEASGALLCVIGAALPPGQSVDRAPMKASMREFSRSLSATLGFDPVIRT